MNKWRRVSTKSSSSEVSHEYGEDIIREQRQRGVTIVLVTHKIFQARRLADRIALLLAGRLLEVASALELLDSPRDPRARSFLNGEMVW